MSRVVAVSFGGSSESGRWSRSTARRLLSAMCMLAASLTGAGVANGEGLGFDQLAALRAVGEVQLSPDGSLAAYTLVVPRRPGSDDDGPAWQELHVVAMANGSDRSFISGHVNVSAIRFTPDGKLITYLAKRGDDEHAALWAIPVDGGESRRLLSFATAITDYRISPDGTRIAFVALEPESEARKKAEEEGFDQEVFEEDWLPRKVWIAELPGYEPEVSDPTLEEPDVEPEALPLEGSAFHVRWNPDGEWLAVDLAPSPLIDDRYMNRRVHVVNAISGTTRAVIANPGKLGDFEFSPDGRTVAMISAADPHDPKDGRLMIVPTAGGELRDVLPGLEGHVSAFSWRETGVLEFLADEGVETRLGEVELVSGRQTSHLISGSTSDGTMVPVMHSLSLSADGTRMAVVGDTPRHPSEVYAIDRGVTAPRRLTDSNPWLASVDLVPQEVFRWQGRDGLGLEGILLRPAGADGLPLIMMVHGGPEGHRRNGWLTSYSAPAQVAASRGYAVFFPNY
ncbi:MAG: LpqB family beta-propeller domain-containing protein, partial [Acidobacteriota bacterium]